MHRKNKLGLGGAWLLGTQSRGVQGLLGALMGLGSPLLPRSHHSCRRTYWDLGGVLLPDEPDIFHSLFCKKETQ